MRTKQKLVILFLLFFVVFFIWYGVLSGSGKGLTVAFLDVGQGDAIFIQSPSGVQVLIDGGAGSAVLRSLSKQMSFFDRSLDVVVATHPDSDHIGGLIDVLEAYKVENIILSSVVNETPVSKDFDEHVMDEGAVVTEALRGQVIDMGEGVFMRTLFPDRILSGGDANAGSIITQLIYGDIEFLFTGDAPQAIEEYLAFIDEKTLKSDVLKVGHHGSRTSSSELFVGWVSPEYAVVSRGCDNSYGHPHSEVLDVMSRFEIEVLDTCEEGTIVFISNGESLSVK